MILILRKYNCWNIFKGRILEKIDQNTTIYYARGKPPIFIVDARDFCLITRIYKLGDGHYLAICILFIIIL